MIGGSGNGEQIAANKVPGIRAALAWNIETAKLARQHNDAQIVAITVFVGMRLAFSSINAALGAGPDPELLEAAPAEVVGLVDYGRPVTD